MGKQKFRITNTGVQTSLCSSRSYRRAMSRCKIMAHHVFKETIRSYWYAWLILTQFFRELLEEEKSVVTSRRTMWQPTRQTAEWMTPDRYSAQLTTCKLWSPRSPDLNPWDYLSGKQGSSEQSTLFVRTER